MEKNLKKFYENIEIIDDKMAIYTDEKGNRALLNPVGLYLSVEYQQVRAGEKELKVLRFDGKVAKDKEPSKTTITIPASKYEETKKEEDRYNLYEKEIEVYELWLVKNGAGIEEYYLDKEEALAFYDEIKTKIDAVIYK